MSLIEALPVPEVRSTSERLRYEGKPIALGFAKEFCEHITWGEDGEARFVLPDGTSIAVPSELQKDHIPSVMNTLLGNLHPGSEFEPSVTREDENYKAAKIAQMGGKPLTYGDLVYYPLDNLLVWRAPEDLCRLAMLARTQDMLQDRGMKLNYEEIRRRFNDIVIGVIGASVASIAFHRLRDTLFCKAMKIADFDVFDDAVRVRRRFGIKDYLQNKAIVTAREANEADHRLPIFVYPEGVAFENITEFLHGDTNTGEPGVTDVVEAIDNPEEKTRVSLEAKKAGKPVWRLSDLAGARQVEYLPFDTQPDFPIGITHTDEEVLTALDEAQTTPSHEAFFRFAEMFIGDFQRRVPEFAAFLDQQGKTPFNKGIPQLAIASEAAASQLALGLASVHLGWEWPNRYFVDERTGTIIRDWVKKHGDQWTLEREDYSAYDAYNISALVDLGSKRCTETTVIDLSEKIVYEYSILSGNMAKVVRIGITTQQITCKNQVSPITFEELSNPKDLIGKLEESFTS